MSGDDEFEGMNRAEIEHVTQEWSEPDPFSDWLCGTYPREILADAYLEASEALSAELKDTPIDAENKPFTEIERRAGLERAAYGHIDSAIADAYEEYKTNHPHNVGHVNDYFGRLYFREL